MPALSREPMFNAPVVVVASVAILLAVHAVRALLSEAHDVELLLHLAVLPAQWTLFFDPQRLAEVMSEAVHEVAPAEVPWRLALARLVTTEPGPRPWSLITYALLHGSWMHVVLNDVWLLAFGTPVARRFGPLRFLLLAALAAIGAAVAHLAAHPLSVAPMIGASGSVSGLMAAATRFVFSPATYGPGGRNDAHARPAPGLRALVANRQAMVFVLLWFATNLLFGLVSAPLGITDASIAWEAHIGGFVTGFVLFPFLDPRRR